jgi:hypothetical protein
MENQDIRRGIDFENRFGQTAWHISHAFSWWQGKKLNGKSFIFIISVFIINLLIIYPLFGRDLTKAYTSSAFLLLVSQFFQAVFHLPKQVLFSFLTIVSLSFVPVSFYLFVRRMALRHEFTALLATLILILPNPFFYNTPILVNALLHGDGAHVLVFSSLPLLLLYVQAFFAKGIPLLGFLSVITTAFIAIVSPFMLFNLVIFYSVLVLAEGFQGKLRLKLLRYFFLLLSSGALCLFWYYPNLFTRIVFLKHVQFAFVKFTSIMPLAIPIIPVAGALAFLLFDRREKLKPIFVGLSLFLVYMTLYATSAQLNISGIFTADRYLPELVFSASFFLSMLFVLLSELIIRNTLLRENRMSVLFLSIACASFGLAMVVLLTVRGIGIVHEYLDGVSIENNYSGGIGTIHRVFDIRDVSSIIASLISVGTLLFLLFLVKKYPSVRKNV